jgi:hypothetical protein
MMIEDYAREVLQPNKMLVVGISEVRMLKDD